MRRLLLLLTLLLVPALAAGCSGGDDDDAAPPATAGGTTTAPAVDEKRFGTEDPRFGRLLVRFVKEADAANTLGMWNLLSSATQASIGPSLAEFRNGAAREFEEGVGSLAGTAEVILSRRIGDFGTAAIVGEREAEGVKERFAYAVSFLEEEGEWRIELGGIIITGLRPEPLARAPEQPPLAADVGAGGSIGSVLMFLDGEPFHAEREGDSPFAAKLRGRPSAPLADGTHNVVVFADAGVTASAIAWTFRVGEGEG